MLAGEKEPSRYEAMARRWWIRLLAEREVGLREAAVILALFRSAPERPDDRMTLIDWARALH